MDLKKSIKFIDKQIESLEAATYMFENIVQPRYEQDRKILNEMKAQALKIRALMQKVEAGEQLSQEEIYTLPVQFR